MTDKTTGETTTESDTYTPTGWGQPSHKAKKENIMAEPETTEELATRLEGWIGVDQIIVDVMGEAATRLREQEAEIGRLRELVEMGGRELERLRTSSVLEAVDDFIKTDEAARAELKRRLE